ncbi:hypothetical protein FO519_002703 [Halicephalobus sp. NKZ332]|nr:hypothetical protein FO519_002703 [Halicephalobus sp. NKZ332]
MTVKPLKVKVEYPCLNEKIKCKDSTLAEFRDAVIKFERNSSRFFFDHSGADKSFARKAITTAGNKLLNTIPLSATEAQKCYWSARVHHMMNPTNPRALELAEKALRLNAFMVDAYILMANINWAMKDLNKAKICIHEAHSTEPSPKTMAYLSSSFRIASTQVKDTRQKEILISKAIEMAKSALKISPDYVFAQYNLGMSYFYMFFLPERKNETFLKCGIAICEKATEHPDDPFLRSDLFINLAEGYIFLQDYGKAIDRLKMAQKLEGNLNEQEGPLAALYADLQKLYFEYDKQKSAVSIQKAMNPELDLDDEKKTQSITDIEINPKAAIVVKVLAQITTSQSTPKNYVVEDSSSNVAVLSIYNVGDSIKILVKDLLTLTDLSFMRTSLPYLGDIEILKATEPEKILKNGKPLDPSEIQATSLSVNIH